MIFQKNLPFFNVVADGKASLELPIGMTYHRIVLGLGGTTFTKAMITRVVCKLNGKIFYDITGDHLDKLNKYRGLADDAGFLTIDFTEPFAKTLGGMNAGRIGTAKNVNSFTVEIDIAGATAPTLESWSQISGPTEETRINGIIPHPATFSAGGKFPITLPHGREAAFMIQRVHFFHANMTALEVKKNGLIIFEEMSSAINEFIQKEHGKVPQAGLYVYDPCVNNDLSHVVNTENAQSLSFNTSVSAADTINLYSEVVGELANF